MSIEQRLKENNITLPEPSSPAANYVPYVVNDNMVYISGQLPLGDGNLDNYLGVVGKDFTIEQANAIARICGLNVVAQVKAACGGDLERVKRCVKLGIFVRSASDFTDQPKVANGASDVMVEVFGEKGKHARFAVGANQLPRGTAVEVDAIFAIE